MFDLKSFREEILKLTQEELARLVDERQDKISRMEKNPTGIGLDLLIKIADATGTTLDELVHYEKQLPHALHIVDTWKPVEEQYKKIMDFFEERVAIHGVEDLLKWSQRSFRKPKVAVIGLSDTGKSTLINALIGSEKLPSAWTPTTSITLYIKHVDDRPDYIEDDVWFMGGWEEDSIPWQSEDVIDEDKTRPYLIRKGHIADLQTYAVRQEEEGEREKTRIQAAIVYIEAPILKVCDLIDLPGYNTGDRSLDTILTKQIRDVADIVIYMSLANGFMRGNEMEYLKADLRYLPTLYQELEVKKPLNNLYILASQAHVVDKGNQQQLAHIMDEGSKRLYGQLPQSIWKSRKVRTGMEYAYEDFRRRFFSYSKDLEGLRIMFETDLKEYLEAYPTLYYKHFISNLMHRMEGLRMAYSKEDTGKTTENNGRVEVLEMNQEERMLWIQRSEEPVRKRLTELKRASIEAFRKSYEAWVNEEQLIQCMEEQGFTNTKTDIRHLANYIQNQLQGEFEKVIHGYSKEYTQAFDGFIAQVDEELLQKNIGIKGKYIAKDTLSESYNYKVYDIGANAQWLQNFDSTVGGIANGFAMSGIVGLGIGLTMLAVASGLSAFGNSWKKSLSKKIVKGMSTEGVLELYLGGVESFWAGTQEGFESVCRQLETIVSQEDKQIRRENRNDLETLYLEFKEHVIIN